MTRTFLGREDDEYVGAVHAVGEEVAQVGKIGGICVLNVLAHRRDAPAWEDRR
jgi:hypothetical protein